MHLKNKLRQCHFITFLLIAVLAGCKGGGGGGGYLPDTTAPVVTATVPSPGAADVPVNTPVVARFDEPLDPTTVNAATFLVSDGSGTIAGSILYSGTTVTFTPQANLATNTTYTATVTTGIRNKTGLALAANHVWHFTTGSMKAWGQPVLVEALPDLAEAPAVAADPDANGTGDGIVTAVWVQSDGTQKSVYASRYTGTWSTPETIETESTGGFSGGASVPRVAMNKYGQAAAVWGYSTGPGNYRIWSNRYDNGAWQTAEEIDALSGNANSPQLAFDGSGDDFFSVWSQYQYGSAQYNYRIVQREFQYVRCSGDPDPACVDAASSWQSMSLLDSHDVGDAGEPRIAAWGTRNAAAVWTQNTPAGNQVWANIAANGSWSGPVRVNGSTNSVAGPMIAADGNGNAIALWMEWAPARTTLFASRYALGSWSAPVQIDDPAGDNAGGYDPPRQQVVMDANGDAIIVWQQANADRSEYSIYARHCPAGPLSGCSAPVTIEQAAGRADFPALAPAPNGDVIAVWKQQDGPARRIYANRFSASGGTWDASPGLVGGADGTWNDGPQIAIDGAGNATVVWVEYEAGQYNIYANRYE